VTLAKVAFSDGDFAMSAITELDAGIAAGVVRAD